MSKLRTKAEVTYDEHGNITVRPPPAIFDVQAYFAEREGTEEQLRRVFDKLKKQGIKVTLSEEGRAKMARLCPDLLEELEGESNG